MIELKLLISLLIPVLAGQTLLWALFGRNYFPWHLSLALAYGLGTGILSQVMLCLGILKIPFSVPYIGLGLFVFAGLFFIFKKDQPKALFPTATKESPAFSTWEILLWAFILYLAIIVFWRSWNIPVYSWDAIATVSFKAKIFFYQKGLVALDVLPHRSYPLHMPFLQTWTALNLGKWDDQWVNFLIPFTFCAYLTIQYQFLKLLTDRTWALVGTALLVSSSQFTFFATIPYRELFLIYYSCTSIMFLLLWQRKNVDNFLILAGLMSGFMTFTKLEGMGYLAIHIGLLLLIVSAKPLSVREKIRKIFKFLLPSLAIYLLYFSYKILSHFNTTERTDLEWAVSNLTRIPITFGSFAKVLFLSGNWNIIWFLLLVSFLNPLRQGCKREIQGLVVTLLMFFGFYFLVNLLITTNFIVITGEKTYELLPRIVLHFYPLATLLIVLLNFPGPTKDHQ